MTHQHFAHQMKKPLRDFLTPDQGFSGHGSVFPICIPKFRNPPPKTKNAGIRLRQNREISLTRQSRKEQAKSEYPLHSSWNFAPFSFFLMVARINFFVNVKNQCTFFHIHLLHKGGIWWYTDSINVGAAICRPLNCFSGGYYPPLPSIQKGGIPWSGFQPNWI